MWLRSDCILIFYPFCKVALRTILGQATAAVFKASVACSSSVCRGTLACTSVSSILSAGKIPTRTSEDVIPAKPAPWPQISSAGPLLEYRWCNARLQYLKAFIIVAPKADIMTFLRTGRLTRTCHHSTMGPTTVQRAWCSSTSSARSPSPASTAASRCRPRHLFSNPSPFLTPLIDPAPFFIERLCKTACRPSCAGKKMWQLSGRNGVKAKLHDI